MTPEERELEKKRTELGRLQTELAELELGLAELRVDLIHFERTYNGRVGVLYTLLDDLEAQIAETIAGRRPTDETARAQAKAARAKADQSAAESKSTEIALEEREASSEDLGRLYRKAARTIHPDLALDEAEKRRRQRVMAEVNEAYEKGDQKRLQEILDKWQSAPERIEGEGIVAELIRTIRKIDQVTRRIEAIQEERTELEASDLYRLKKQVEDAKAAGRDLLDELAQSVNPRIDEARARLNQIRRETAL